MSEYYIAGIPCSAELYHHGVLGQKWGQRNYQNPDGSLTPLGRIHYGYGKAKEKVGKAARATGKGLVKAAKVAGKGVQLTAKYATLPVRRNHSWMLTKNEMRKMMERYDMESQFKRSKYAARGESLTKKMLDAAGQISYKGLETLAKKTAEKAADKIAERAFESADERAARKAKTRRQYYEDLREGNEARQQARNNELADREQEINDRQRLRDLRRREFDERLAAPERRRQEREYRRNAREEARSAARENNNSDTNSNISWDDSAPSWDRDAGLGNSRRSSSRNEESSRTSRSDSQQRSDYRQGMDRLLREAESREADRAASDYVTRQTARSNYRSGIDSLLREADERQSRSSRSASQQRDDYRQGVEEMLREAERRSPDTAAADYRARQAEREREARRMLEEFNGEYIPWPNARRR